MAKKRLIKKLQSKAKELARRKSRRKAKKVILERIPETNTTDGFIPPENVSTDTTFFDYVVISNYRANIQRFNERASSLLNEWFDRILSTNDIHDVAIMIEDGANAGIVLTWEVLYHQEKLRGYIYEMLDYLPEAGPLFKAELMETLEQFEDWELPT